MGVASICALTRSPSAGMHGVVLASSTREGVAHWIAVILTGPGIEIVAVPRGCWAQRISRFSNPVVSMVLHVKNIELRCCKPCYAGSLQRSVAAQLKALEYSSTDVEMDALAKIVTSGSSQIVGWPWLSSLR